MDAQRPNVEEVFLQAVQKDPAERPAFLDATCADSKVRTRVEALLKAHDTAGRLFGRPGRPASPLAGTQNPVLSRERSSACRAHETLDFLDRCDTPDRLGLLAHYEILEILGRGGMGIVLRGVDVKLNRVVAIKVLAPQLAANAMARQRFLREAQAAAAVSHEHVVAIHAVDECNGLPYLVMEYISGPSLQQKIDGGGALRARPDSAHRHADRVGPGGGACAGSGPSRHQAGQHPAGERHRTGQDHRFRSGPQHRRRPDHASRRGVRDPAVHVARTGAGRARRSALGPVQPGQRAVRHVYGAASFPWRYRPRCPEAGLRRHAAADSGNQPGHSRQRWWRS